ncbi:nicotinate-nucleotide--dimethylbenzimidazole phosphoribosyltransferase [Streptomyces sp. NPDC002561]|uniref:nicotinate-nucleotide--dimethylbenzimidazole phosphoribosyltransferase n=1 Tax=unclassified Streptomyces TaxID=2593676 RepID=UPI00332CF435
MSDTGQIPVEGLPENAGTVEQPGIAAPDAYTYLAPSEHVPEDDDLLLMPSPQGAWSDPQTVPAPGQYPEPVAVRAPVPGQGVHPAQAAAQPYAQPTAEAPAQPQGPVQVQVQEPVQAPAADVYAAAQQAVAEPPAVTGRGTHESGGRDSGSVDLSGVRIPSPAQVPAQAAQSQTPTRRPLHRGPAVADGGPSYGGASTGGVVRSLADRGPAGAPPAPVQPQAPAQTQAQAPAPQAAGPEYFAPDDDAAVLPGPQLGEILPQGGSPWAAQPAAVPVTAEATAESVVPEQGAEPAAESAAEPVAVAQPMQAAPAVAPEAVAAPVAEPVPGAVEAPAGIPAEGLVEAAVPADAAVPVETAVPVEGAVSVETAVPQEAQGTPETQEIQEIQGAPETQEVQEVQGAQEAVPMGQFVPVEGSVPTTPHLAPTPVAEQVPAQQDAEQIPVQLAEQTVGAGGAEADSAAGPEHGAIAVEPAQDPRPDAGAVPAGDAGESAAPAGAIVPVEGAEAVRAAEGVHSAAPAEVPAQVPGPVADAGAPGPDAPGPEAEAGPEVIETPDPTTPADVVEAAPLAEPVAAAPLQDTVTEHDEIVFAQSVDRPRETPEAAPAPGTEPLAAEAPEPAGAPETAGAPEAQTAEVPVAAAPVVEEPPAAGAPQAPAAETPAAEAPGAEASESDEAPVPAGPPAPGYDDAEREAVLRVMRERRDIRNGFRNDPIPHEVLLRVLEAAHTAPSVGHSQPWDFVVIRSAETRRAMHELAQRQRDAYAKSLPKGRAKQFKELKIEAILDTPVNIVVTADPTRGGRHTLGRHTQPQMAPYSSALAVENLWLAARAEGLGVGWVSFFDEREMVRALGLPEHLEVVAYLCVGYVDEFPEEPELMQAGWSKRRPLSWVVHEETYGRRALPGEEPHDLLQETIANIRPLDAKALGEAWERQKRMTKPAGALGMLEIISAQLAGLSRVCPPPIPEPAAVAIFAGDHGVHAQGVTAWPQEVTGQMVANFLGGGAVCNAFASQVGAEVCVIDVGVAAELPATPGLLPRKVRAGTADFTTGPALTREEVLAAIEVGIETARDLVAAGNKGLLTGEMGIANTTASAALICVYTGMDPAEVTGRGTGINDEMHARKVDVVRRALEFHQPDPADPIGVLAAVGGLEHAAMAGFLLGGASLRTPVILDGVSAGAAALVARAIAPEALAACIAGHRSAEPGHVAALNKLGLRPLVDLDLRLGEGTGALLALPIVQSAARAMHEVATFDAAGVTEK